MLPTCCCRPGGTVPRSACTCWRSAWRRPVGRTASSTGSAPDGGRWSRPWALPSSCSESSVAGVGALVTAGVLVPLRLSSGGPRWLRRRPPAPPRGWGQATPTHCGPRPDTERGPQQRGRRNGAQSAPRAASCLASWLRHGLRLHVGAPAVSATGGRPPPQFALDIRYSSHPLADSSLAPPKRGRRDALTSFLVKGIVASCRMSRSSRARRQPPPRWTGPGPAARRAGRPVLRRRARGRRRHSPPEGHYHLKALEAHGLAERSRSAGTGHHRAGAAGVGGVERRRRRRSAIRGRPVPYADHSAGELPRRAGSAAGAPRSAPWRAGRRPASACRRLASNADRVRSAADRAAFADDLTSRCSTWPLATTTTTGPAPAPRRGPPPS